MPDPNVRKPRLLSQSQRDASKTPKVRKDPKFIGTQKYGREFMCKVQHNQLTDEKKGTRKFKVRADSGGNFVRPARQASTGRSFPSREETYKGGFEGPGARVPIAQNTR